METALRTRVIAALSVGSRVYWGIRPQASAYPAAVLSIVSDERTQNMDGFNGFRATRVQVDVYAMTYAEVAAMREAVIAGVVPAATVGGTTFLRAFVNNVLNRGDESAAGYVHRQMIDLTIWHN